MSNPTNPPIQVPHPHPVQVHHYLPRSSPSNEPPRPLQTYEHVSYRAPHAPPPQNALVFIGGLGDGPHTIPYVQRLVPPLSPPPPGTTPSRRDEYDFYNAGYSVFEARLSSAFTGFGHGCLAKDVQEIRDLVRYLKKGLGMRRVVLMGHSTGCQDCLEYAAVTQSLEDWEEQREEMRVDGYILQGPVSDREAIWMGEDPVEVAGSLRVARGMVQEGKGGDVMERGVMPKGWRGSPVTAYRWASLAGLWGDDDYFSSDLSDDRLAVIWGRLEQPVLIVPSEKDEWVPAGTDVMGLVRKWMGFCKPGIASELSGLIPGANHRVENEAGQQWLADRVARFLAEIGK